MLRKLLNIQSSIRLNNKSRRCFLSTAPPEQVKDMILTLGQQNWQATLEKLQGTGFTYKQSTQMLLKNPSITKYPLEKLNHYQEVLKSFGFKTEEIKEMLTTHPEIFDHPQKALKSNHHVVLKEMGNHNGRVTVLRAPNVLTDNSLVTSQKILYCTLEMFLSKPVISTSKILQCPLNLIQTRHKFAYRAGIYRKIDEKNKEGLSENPSISSLFFCSNEVFLKLFQGFTLEDYTVFETLVSLENQGEDDGDEEDMPENEGKLSYRRKK